MNERAHARLMMEENLRSATERNDFELLFQPQVMLASGKLRGFEGLRWPQGDAGENQPGNFIPLLEETRLIERVGNGSCARA